MQKWKRKRDYFTTKIKYSWVRNCKKKILFPLCASSNILKGSFFKNSGKERHTKEEDKWRYIYSGRGTETRDI